MFLVNNIFFTIYIYILYFASYLSVNIQKAKKMVRKIKTKISTTFRALKQRNFRLFFTGQSISLIGSWIQNIAMSWLIYTLTKSAFMMGMITFINALPNMFVTPIAGVIIDRVNKYKLLIWLQSFFLLQALLLAILTLLGVISVWHIIVIGLLTNLTAAFDMPLRQAIVINLVDNPRDLSNAISLNSTNFNLARLLGPAIAGILIAKFSEGICFLINAISYIAVIWALLLIHIELPPKERLKKNDFLPSLIEGIKYAKDTPPIRLLLLTLTFVSFIGISYPLLMPIFVDEILKGDARTLGILMSTSGVGALVASLILATRQKNKDLSMYLFGGSLSFGCSFVGIGLTENIFVASAMMFCLGFGMVLGLIACNTMLQQIVDDDKRGRIMSLYTVAFIGTVPWGNLFAGSIAHWIGIVPTFGMLGTMLIIAACIYQHYAKKISFASYIQISD